MNCSRFLFAFVLVMVALAGISTTTLGGEPAKKARIATQTELTSAFPSATTSQVNELGNVTVSRHAVCDYPEDYGEVMSTRSERAGGRSVNPARWQIARCKINYEGPKKVCVIVRKDEILYSMDHRRTFEAGEKFCGYQLGMRRLWSKAGYYSLDPVPTIRFNQIPDYFTDGRGTLSVNPHMREICYKGPYQLFAIPGGGWTARAYGARWTKGNVLGSRKFCVFPSLTLFGFIKF